MTMEALFNNVENAIAQYEQACEQEETLYDMMRDAENDMNRYSSKHRLLKMLLISEQH